MNDQFENFSNFMRNEYKHLTQIGGINFLSQNYRNSVISCPLPVADTNLREMVFKLKIQLGVNSIEEASSKVYED